MCRRLRPSQRAGMSLAELTMSLAILTMIAATVGTMAMAMQTATTYVRGQSNALQHGRVVLARIDRLLQEATISETFPGLAVISWTVGSDTFPDTLVIWKPAGTAVDPTGLPRANELVIIRPDPNNPGTLIEVTNPSEPATVTFAPTDTVNWRTLVTTLCSRSNASKLELTNLMRVAAVDNLASESQRGCVRFRSRSTPSDTEIASYRAGTLTWTSLAWPQDIVSRSMALRSVGCYVELQLVTDAGGSSADAALPLFGSTVLWKEMQR